MYQEAAESPQNRPIHLIETIRENIPPPCPISQNSQQGHQYGRTEVLTIRRLQVYREALESPQCSAIHLTQIQEDVPCDTFFPALDPASWRLWSSTAPHRQNELRFAFLCYTPAAQAAPPRLPAAVAGRHEEYQVPLQTPPPSPPTLTFHPFSHHLSINALEDIGNDCFITFIL